MTWNSVLPIMTIQLGRKILAQVEDTPDLCPPKDKVFRAFDLTPPDKVKVVVVGQDPYHTPGVANGLAFSASPDAPIPPSLKNIYKELVADIKCGFPLNGDLTRWAERGVLLLNASLTVEEHKPNSHANLGWHIFTKEVLSLIRNFQRPVVFILWGTFVQNFKNDIINSLYTLEPNGIIKMPKTKKAIIMSSHPSPLSARKTCGDTPAFFGSRPFSNANRLLEEYGTEPIDWSLLI